LVAGSSRALHGRLLALHAERPPLAGSAGCGRAVRPHGLGRHGAAAGCPCRAAVWAGLRCAWPRRVELRCGRGCGVLGLADRPGANVRPAPPGQARLPVRTAPSSLPIAWRGLGCTL